MSTLFFGFLRHTAISNACRTTSVVWQLCNGPANDTTGVEVHDGQIGAAFQHPDIGNIRHPDPVRGLHVKLPVQRVIDDHGRPYETRGG